MGGARRRLLRCIILVGIHYNTTLILLLLAPRGEPAFQRIIIHVMNLELSFNSPRRVKAVA